MKEKNTMLLRHTTAEVVERQALTVNPAKTCQPIGAMYAALGVHGCLPHSHGSQGCCSYHRSTLTRHYKEPVMAATSSFTEGSSVFGGQANLLQAIQNIFAVYEPDVIAVHTTCLSETIGDDIPQIVNKARDEKKIPAGKHVIHANTPSYVGSHVTGYANMVRGMVHYFAEPSDARTAAINLIPGWVEPADMREIKRLAGLLVGEAGTVPIGRNGPEGASHKGGLSPFPPRCRQYCRAILTATSTDVAPSSEKNT
jgi:nitrogenase molybdenum-iron protein beta chain